MSNREIVFQEHNNVIQLPLLQEREFTPPLSQESEIAKSQSTYARLDKESSFKSDFNWKPLYELENRAERQKGFRGGILFKSPLKLVNNHPTCQKCHYAFELDTYGRGCVHDCAYCYAKAQLTVHGYWNNPFPAPVDLSVIRNAFYTTFETDRPSKWRTMLEKRIPLRIGSMSDSFMWMDKKYKVSQELLKILKHYKYPNVIFTHSDLVAEEEYLKLMDPKLTSVQISMSSTNDELNKKIEPGSPSAKRRLTALSTLNEAGIWTAVRINPLFPIYPDGYFSDKSFSWEGPVPMFNYFSFEMVDEIAAVGTKSILAGFGRLSGYSVNQLVKATGVNLRVFYRDDSKKSKRDFHYSDSEIRYYYVKIAGLCMKNNIQFSTCYIGNGESHYYKDQDLWANKSDCCNIKGHVEGFKKSCHEIPQAIRDRLNPNSGTSKLELELSQRNLISPSIHS
jgi:DNA repair photolyase